MIGFFFINYIKYNQVRNEIESIFHYVLFFYLNIPSYIMALTANRYFIMNTYFLCLLCKVNRQLKLIKRNVVKYAIVLKMKRNQHQQNFYDNIGKQLNQLIIFYFDLQNVCLESNQVYGIHVLLIIGFCFYNAVFEVLILINYDAHFRNIRFITDLLPLCKHLDSIHNNKQI